MNIGIPVRRLKSAHAIRIFSFETFDTFGFDCVERDIMTPPSFALPHIALRSIPDRSAANRFAVSHSFGHARLFPGHTPNIPTAS
jgi:hypothetical protein